jgi:tRNA (adenine22-N1)-methyltransferase
MKNTDKKIPRLDARLAAAAEMVRGDVAADIGTDHGYLASYLILSGKCSRVIASDVNPMPLEKCRATAEALGASDSIDIFLADGLDGLPLEEKGVTDIIICGMGGELISRIIDRSDYTRRSGVNLVLGAMSSIGELRDYLCEHGFAVTAQRTVMASGKLYQLISAEYTGEAYTITSVERCIGTAYEKEKNNPLFAAIAKRELEKAESRLAGKRLGGRDAAEDEELARSLHELLRECRPEK